MFPLLLDGALSAGSFCECKQNQHETTSIKRKRNLDQQDRKFPILVHHNEENKGNGDLTHLAASPNAQNANEDEHRNGDDGGLE